jgi:hypothetical protein
MNLINRLFLREVHDKKATFYYHPEQGEPGSEDQKSYVLLHMWTLDLGQIQQGCRTWIT